MATTTCFKCSGHSFESVLFTPLGTAQRLTMVQCADCGTPVAVVDPNLQATLNQVKHQVSAIDEGLRRIALALD